METQMASLHAGLIQRARPDRARPVPPRDGAEFGPRSNVLPLRGGEPAGARPSAPRRASEAYLGRAPAAAVWAEPEPRFGWPFRRRFGLTVRVGGAIRELLLHARMHTGRTTQSILHDALVQYLARIEADRDPR